jgi:hypothetical protein
MKPFRDLADDPLEFVLKIQSWIARDLIDG